jgi:hypothetical protein
MQSQRGSANLPRYWITLGKKIIWDYPRQFVQLPSHPQREPLKHYPYSTDVPTISSLIREYIDTPEAQLLTRPFDGDHWGLSNILRAADRRLGAQRLNMLRRRTRNQAAIEVLEARDRARSAHLKPAVRSVAGEERQPNNRMQLTKSAPRKRGRRRLRS